MKKLFSGKNKYYAIVILILILIGIIISGYYLNNYIKYSGVREFRYMLTFYDVKSSPNKIWSDSKYYAIMNLKPSIIERIFEPLSGKNNYYYSEGYKKLLISFGIIKRNNIKELREEYYNKNFLYRSLYLLEKGTELKSNGIVSKVKDIIYIKVVVLTGKHKSETGWVKLNDWLGIN